MREESVAETAHEALDKRDLTKENTFLQRIDEVTGKIKRRRKDNAPSTAYTRQDGRLCKASQNQVGGENFYDNLRSVLHQDGEVI